MGVEKMSKEEWQVEKSIQNLLKSCMPEGWRIYSVSSLVSGVNLSPDAGGVRYVVDSPDTPYFVGEKTIPGAIRATIEKLWSEKNND